MVRPQTHTTNSYRALGVRTSLPSSSARALPPRRDDALVTAHAQATRPQGKRRSILPSEAFRKERGTSWEVWEVCRGWAVLRAFLVVYRATGELNVHRSPAASTPRRIFTQCTFFRCVSTRDTSTSIPVVLAGEATSSTDERGPFPRKVVRRRPPRHPTC